jgi:hypothetical protein
VVLSEGRHGVVHFWAVRYAGVRYAGVRYAGVHCEGVLIWGVRCAGGRNGGGHFWVVQSEVADHRAVRSVADDRRAGR